MTEPAAPPAGRRISLGSAVVLAGYLLLAPPLFVVGPFLLLSLLSRPQTLRELFWLLLAAIAAGLSFQGPRALVPDLIRALGVVLSVVFALSSRRASASLISRVLATIFASAVLVGLWEWSRGLDWPTLHQAFTTMLRDGYQAMARPGGPGTPVRPDIQTLVQPFIDMADELARALPGLLALEAIAGLALAWLWHHKIAATPLGQPPGRFRTFRFNDHLIWGAIFTLALLLAPLPSEITVLAENLLILWVGLYAMRGLAIAASFFGPAPLALRAFAAILATVLFPLGLGSCLALGLADTWLDLRRRLAPPATGGM